jgi:hypothetical protein
VMLILPIIQSILQSTYGIANWKGQSRAVLRVVFLLFLLTILLVICKWLAQRILVAYAPIQ